MDTELKIVDGDVQRQLTASSTEKKSWWAVRLYSIDLELSELVNYGEVNQGLRSQRFSW